MSLKKIRQVKADKGFKIGDLILYGAVAVLIAALFLTFFLTSDTTPAQGFQITYNGNAVFRYDFYEEKYAVLRAENIEIVSESEEELLLVFYTDGRGGYNKITVDKGNRSVRVTDADCSARKDCVYMPAVSDNSSVIVCMRHSMVIEPLDYEIVDDGIILT